MRISFATMFDMCRALRGCELSFDVSRGVTEIYPDFAVAWGDFCDVSLQTSDTCTRFSVLNGTFFSLFQLLHKSRSIQGRTKRNGVFFSDFMWTCSHPPRICVYAYMHGRGNRSLISISFRKRVRWQIAGLAPVKSAGKTIVNLYFGPIFYSSFDTWGQFSLDTFDRTTLIGFAHVHALLQEDQIKVHTLHNGFMAARDQNWISADFFFVRNYSSFTMRPFQWQSGTWRRLPDPRKRVSQASKMLARRKAT